MNDDQLWRVACDLHDKLCFENGFSYNPNHPIPDYGYFVSDAHHEYVVKTCTVETIYRYLRDHIEAVTEGCDTLFIGGWCADNGSGSVYLDMSTWVMTLEAALWKAVQAEQLAVFSLADGKTLLIDPDSLTPGFKPSDIRVIES